MSTEELQSGNGEFLLFGLRDELAGIAAFSRFHLDEHECVVIARDDIDLAACRAKVGGDHSKAGFFQEAHRGGFSAVA